MPTLRVKLNPGTPVPAYAKPGDAAFDLHLNNKEAVTIQPGETAAISFGISMEIPAGHFGLIAPRSSLARRGLMLANTVGIIDSGYRGELTGVFRNIGTAPEVLEPGSRLAQLIILPFVHVDFEVTDELSATERGTGAYGSTGH